MHCKAWQSHFRTGVASVDHEHDRLLDTIDAVCSELDVASSAEPVLESLGLLYEKACAHCALEARVAGGPGSDRHPAAGQDVEMLERIGSIMDAFFDGSCAACDKTLDECLRSWFEKHLQSAHALLRLRTATV